MRPEAVRVDPKGALPTSIVAQRIPTGSISSDRQGRPKWQDETVSSSAIAELTADQALERLESGTAVFIDVRDGGSYRRAHIPGAQHIGDHNIQEFIRDTPKTSAVVVYCYHGNSSLGGAAYLQESGFGEVYSMSGGFALWDGKPTETAPEPVAQRPAATPSPATPDPPSREPPPPRRSKRGRLANAARSLARRLLK
jgi:thiosulfate sulfurtransferase